MAEKRMFSNQIIDSDAFLDMPATSQNLYFHLAMRADDEGFINSPKKIMRSIGANENDFDVLVAKGFLIGFESKIYVIKHWWVHNYIRQDRVKSTNYTQEKAMLSVKENGVYTLCQSSVSQVSDKSQASIEEIRLDKSSLEEISIEEDNMSSKGLISLCVDVVLYLNQKANTNFRTGIKKTNSFIEARKKEGFTLEDFKTVIDKKTAQWKNDKKMCAYLRPETLFGNKFESYLNENVKASVNCWADDEVIDASF